MALDFAFLLSYSSRLEVDEKLMCPNGTVQSPNEHFFLGNLCTQGVEIVMNLEDDVRVTKNFVSKILRFRRSLKKYEARHFTHFPAAFTDVFTYFLLVMTGYRF